jgi:hypothetical protein
MIALGFLKPHRSILALPPTELPDLAVITGVNGSGKSHLLEAIKNGSVAVADIKPTDEDVRLFNWTNLVPGNAGAVDPIQIGRERGAFITQAVGNLRAQKEAFLRRLQKHNIPGLPLSDMDALAVMTRDDYLASGGSVGHVPLLEQLWAKFRQQCLQALGNNTLLHGLLSQGAKELRKPLVALTADEMDELLPLNWHPTDMFQQTFSQIFAAYHRAWDDNRYRSYANSHYGENNHVLSNEAFHARFGSPPWDFVNRLLDEAHLDYSINHPTGRPELPFEAKLRNKTTGAEVAFQDLSSGEQIIMSFALCLYNASDKTRYVRYPKLLLFDEIDAPLHPTMTKDLIRVIDRVLVREKGVKVILTTHSPATVAFATEGALFRLDRHPRTLTSCSREQAIVALTSGYISVTESSRFVLTEAKRDRQLYTRLFNKLVERSALPSLPNLIFVQASDKKDKLGGGREQVKDWGSKLPAAGLSDVLGLIDRDSGNKGSATVKVLQRYSIENYIIDPIIVYAVLMSRGQHLAVCDAGIRDANYYELKCAGDSVLQAISDKVCTLIEGQCPGIKLMTGRFGVTYLSKNSISMPIWLRDYRGHDLVDAVRETFRAKIGKEFIVTRDECDDLVDMLSERLPEFIPTDLLSVFHDLQAIRH